MKHQCRSKAKVSPAASQGRRETVKRENIKFSKAKDKPIDFPASQRLSAKTIDLQESTI
jgi:hypothetical protein